MSQMLINRANDLKARYMHMGNWKAEVIKKKGKASRTSATRAKIYIAIPPAEGWPGGDPIRNGLKK